MAGVVADVSAGRASLVFAGPGGLRHREPLERCWDVRFERVPPVRSFPSRRGQRHFPGLWWAATTGDHVGYESWLERDHVMMLDFDPAVVGFSSQPFQLVVGSPGARAVRHVPDFFARRDDGIGVVIDVRPDDRIGPKDAAVFAVTGEVCASVGWSYRRAGGLDPVLAGNVRWLAGYRHPRCLLLQPRPGLTDDLAPVVTEVLAPLLDDELEAGDSVAALRVYSLARPAGPGAVSVHRLDQAVTADQMPAELAGAWRQAAATLIEATIPEDTLRPDTWPDFAVLCRTPKRPYYRQRRHGTDGRLPRVQRQCYGSA